MITVKELKKDREIQCIMETCEKQIDALNYTEHSNRHASIVSSWTGMILKEIGCDERSIWLGEIAGYLHDIGNALARHDHAGSGAILAYNFLVSRGMDYPDAAEIMMAIANHDEKHGIPVSVISSALIIADKSDVRRSRVRNSDISTFDIHDRVNYSVTEAKLTINDDRTAVLLDLVIDTRYGTVMDYFEIFLTRMILCRKAAEKLGLQFALQINGQRML